MERINQPQISGNLKFSPSSGLDLNASVSDLAKLSPAGVIAIGLLVVAFGLYLCSKDKERSEAK